MIMKNKIILFLTFLFGLQMHGAFCAEEASLEDVQLQEVVSPEEFAAMVETFNQTGAVNVPFKHTIADKETSGVVRIADPKRIVIDYCPGSVRTQAIGNNEVCIRFELPNGNYEIVEFSASQNTALQSLHFPSFGGFTLDVEVLCLVACHLVSFIIWRLYNYLGYKENCITKGMQVVFFVSIILTSTAFLLGFCTSILKWLEEKSLRGELFPTYLISKDRVNQFLTELCSGTIKIEILPYFVLDEGATARIVSDPEVLV